MEPLTPEQLAQARSQIAREAVQARWAKTSKKARAKLASDLAKKRASKLTKKQRTEIARKAGKAGGKGRPKKSL